MVLDYAGLSNARSRTSRLYSAGGASLTACAKKGPRLGPINIADGSLLLTISIVTKGFGSNPVPNRILESILVGNDVALPVSESPWAVFDLDGLLNPILHFVLNQANNQVIKFLNLKIVLVHTVVTAATASFTAVAFSDKDKTSLGELR